MAFNPERLTSSPCGMTFSGSQFSSPINLEAQQPAPLTQASGSPVRRLRIDAISSAGSITVVYSNGVSHTIPVIAAGDQIDAMIAQITSVVGVTSATVWW